MDCISKALQTGIEELFQQTLKTAFKQLANDLSDQMKEDGEVPDLAGIVNIWNKIMKDDKMKIDEKKEKKEVAKEKKEKKEVTKEKKDAKCEYKFIKGEKIGECCGSNVSDKSETGKYCSKHYKDENKETKNKKETKDKDSKKNTKCKHVMTTGKRIMETCDEKVSDKSTTGKFCSKHLKDDKDTKKIEEEEEEEEEEIVEVEKKAKAAKADAKEDAKEMKAKKKAEEAKKKAEEEEEEAKKTKKDKKDKKEAKKAKDDEEEEEMDVDKKKEAKKAKDEEDEAKKKAKKDKKEAKKAKDDVDEEENTEKKKDKKDKKVKFAEEDADDEKDTDIKKDKKKPQLSARRFKSSEKNEDFKGMSYFDDQGTTFVFKLEGKKKTCTGKNVDGKLEKLDDDEEKRITTYWKFEYDNKDLKEGDVVDVVEEEDEVEDEVEDDE